MRRRMHSFFALNVSHRRLFIHGVPDAVEIENALIEKKDWSGIRLASYSDARGLAPWVGRRVVPVGVSSLHPDYTGLEVKMAAARVMRVPHGVGLFKTLNRSSSSIAAEKYGIFYGEWHEGESLLIANSFLDALMSREEVGQWLRDRRRWSVHW